MKYRNFIISLFLLFWARLSLSDDPFVFPDKNIKINFSTADVSNDVLFYLYTRTSKDNPQQLVIGDKEVLGQSLFSSIKPTKFMTHGWGNYYKGKNCQTVKDAFLTQDDYNVIVVDWNKKANLTPYEEAAQFIKPVGIQVAKMIDFLAGEGINLNTITLVGHSMGGQVMGFAGLHATNKVGHLVGLDPCGPGFISVGPEEGISKNGATMVEIIHSNIDYWGVTEPRGHADFYPNGGGIGQPGCGDDPKYYCAHDRAYVYYAESLINPNSLLAVSCQDYQAFLAGQCDNATPVSFPNWSGANKEPGLYFLRTADKEPFGLGVAGAKSATS